jgi:ketosteroid isomerase-like protein
MFVATSLMVAAFATAPHVVRAQTTARQAIDTFNKQEADACRTMNHAASESLWADDGVDLIQGLQPMVGKKAISDWLDNLTPQLKGAKIEYCTIDWHDIKIQGDWAYEWGITRQKIDFPPPQKMAVSEGKMLLILKRQTDGVWKIELESWNSLPMRQP